MQQLEPIKKKQVHNRREIRVKDISRVGPRKFDTLNSSLMSYDQIEGHENEVRASVAQNYNAIKNIERDNEPEPSYDQPIIYLQGKSHSRPRLKKQKTANAHMNRSVHRVHQPIFKKQRSYM